jgi:hypothetical protein
MADDKFYLRIGEELLLGTTKMSYRPDGKTLWSEGGYYLTTKRLVFCKASLLGGIIKNAKRGIAGQMVDAISGDSLVDVTEKILLEVALDKIMKLEVIEK